MSLTPLNLNTNSIQAKLAHYRVLLSLSSTFTTLTHLCPLIKLYSNAASRTRRRPAAAAAAPAAAAIRANMSTMSSATTPSSDPEVSIRPVGQARPVCPCLCLCLVSTLQAQWIHMKFRITQMQNTNKNQPMLLPPPLLHPLSLLPPPTYHAAHSLRVLVRHWVLDGGRAPQFRPSIVRYIHLRVCPGRVYD